MNIAPNAPHDIRREFVSLLPRLRRFALTLAADLEEADELVRAACVEAIIEDRCPSGEKCMDPWLFALVRKAATDPARNQRTTKPEKPSAPQGSSTTGQQALILTMPEGQACVFLLVEVEGFSYAQAADILGISIELLASRLCDARMSFAAAAPTAERRA